MLQHGSVVFRIGNANVRVSDTSRSFPKAIYKIGSHDFTFPGSFPPSGLYTLTT